MMRRSIQLRRGTDGEYVEALLTAIAQCHIDDDQNLWREMLQQHQQEDQFWSWEFKRRVFLSQENYEGYGIEVAGRTEGMMMIETQRHRSLLNGGRRLVYVMSIASAPWNRQTIFRPPEFLGVGTALLLYARQRSLDLGYGGGVGLHALPNAEKFYENRHMIRIDPDPEEYCDPDEESLAYFEYPSRD
jgi:hypothetical protein